MDNVTKIFEMRTFQIPSGSCRMIFHEITTEDSFWWLEVFWENITFKRSNLMAA